MSKQIYYSEGKSGSSKYTFEVFQEDDGSYRAIARKWNSKTNKIFQENQYLTKTKAELRTQNYPPIRQVKIFLNSDFWLDANNPV